MFLSCLTAHASDTLARRDVADMTGTTISDYYYPFCVKMLNVYK